MRHVPLLVLSALVVAACSSRESPPLAPPSPQLRVLNAVQGSGTVDLVVDGLAVANGVAFSQLSVPVTVSSGTHEVMLRPSASGKSAGTVSMTFTTGMETVIAIDSSSIINPIVLTDTGAVVPAGASKLRVVHFAAHAPAIDVWRTQPDYSTPIRVMFPFPYRAASPYLQSTPGNWTVMVTPEGSTNALTSSGQIPVEAGHSTTVVLLDGENGGIQLKVLTP